MDEDVRRGAHVDAAPLDQVVARLHGASRALGALEHLDAAARARQVRGGDQRVVTGSYNGDVQLGHGRSWAGDAGMMGG